MTDPPHSTMAAPAAADSSRADSQARTPSSGLPVQPVTKILVTRDLDLTIRAFFPPPTAPTKFNPITAMTKLFRTMLKDEPSLVLRTPNNDMQIDLASESLPTRESDFKKYFKVSTARRENQKSSHVCIGCHVLSNRSIGNIKFKSKDGNLLAWLKKERVFIESDGLGTDRPVTIGHLTKIAVDLTHLANFRDYLANQLMLVDIEAAVAVELAPYLKEAQLEAMSNGDEYVSILPDFEIYRTHLSHGRAPSQVKTDVLGVKCAPRDAKLLGEFFTRMAAATGNDQRDGIFLPKGAANLLGPQTYEQVLREHNFFLTTVATVPINLEYGAWLGVIDPATTSDSEPISLHDHLLRKSWFLRLESVDRHKCLLVTTKPNLPEARAWIDANLEPMIRKSIPEGVDPPSSQLPRRLDKPVFSASSLSYADALKKQFSTVSTATTATTAHNRPPRKRQAAVIDYDSDQSADASSSTMTVNNSIKNQHHSNSTPATMTNTAYATELMELKSEINALKALITTAVDQFKTAVASLATPRSLLSTAMDTEVAESTEQHNQHQTPIDLVTVIQDLKNEIVQSTVQRHPPQTSPDLSATINELKQEIAAFVRETREMLQRPIQISNPFEGFKLSPMPT